MRKRQKVMDWITLNTWLQTITCRQIHKKSQHSKLNCLDSYSFVSHRQNLPPGSQHFWLPLIEDITTEVQLGNYSFSVTLFRDHMC